MSRIFLDTLGNIRTAFRVFGDACGINGKTTTQGLEAYMFRLESAQHEGIMKHK
jgi:hypothetical protein